VYVRDCHKPLTHAGSHEGTRVTTRFLGRVEHYSTIFKETIEIEQWSPGAEEPFTWEV
jgi:hypothetical protein